MLHLTQFDSWLVTYFSFGCFSLQMKILKQGQPRHFILLLVAYFRAIEVKIILSLKISRKLLYTNCHNLNH